MKCPHTLLLALALGRSSWGCTNILVTPTASDGGAAMIGDNDDSSARDGGVVRFAAAEWPEGSTRAIYGFETSEYRGVIAQPAKTLNVMSGANEAGVVIAETTLGGLSELQHEVYEGATKVLDYGSLITATLQRATSARDAIATIAALTDLYGYASSMEGFSITDGAEVWHLELIGRGQWGMGVLYVAMRVPEGYVGAHANQARITQFAEACQDPDACLASPDIVSFAIEHGYYNGSVDDASFSFSDTFDPVTASGARYCEARVWYIFSQLADPSDFNAAAYLDYAQGFNLTNRMPLFVKAKPSGVSRADVHAMMSSHYEGSWFDPSLDVGAGAEHSPYRWNGLTWADPDGDLYVNERTVGTQATAWHFVAQVDATAPAPMRALLWFGVDDHAWAPKVPLYGGAEAVHRSYDDGNCSARVACRQALDLPGYMMEFSWESAFWVNTAVAKLVYAEKDRAAALVSSARCAFEAYLAPLVAATDAAARAQFEAGQPGAGVALLTALAVRATEDATRRWTRLWQELMVTNADGYVASENPSNLMCGCAKASATFTDAWTAKVVADTGDHYRLPGASCAYVDADGHCHSDGQQLTSTSKHTHTAKVTPKSHVRGVLP